MNLSALSWSDIFQCRSNDSSLILAWLFNTFENCVRDHVTSDERLSECRVLGALSESVQMLDEHTCGLEHSVCPTVDFRMPKTLFDLGTITLFVERDLSLVNEQLLQSLQQRLRAVLFSETDATTTTAAAGSALSSPSDVVWSTTHGTYVRLHVQLGCAGRRTDDGETTRSDDYANEAADYVHESVVVSFTLQVKTVNKKLPLRNNIVRFNFPMRDMYLIDMIARISSVSFKYRSYANSGLAKNQEAYYLSALTKLPQNEWLRVLIMDNVSPAQYNTRKLFTLLNKVLTERFAALVGTSDSAVNSSTGSNTTADSPYSSSRPFYAYYALPQSHSVNFGKIRLDLNTIASHPTIEQPLQPIECKIKKTSKHCAVLEPITT